MSRRTILILIFYNCILNSCISQEISKENLKGNWCILSNNKLKELTYTEIFIDENKIYSYTDDIGLKPPSKYIIKENILYHSRLGSTMEKLGKLVLGNNTFSIESEKNKIVFKKVSGSLRLGDFIKEKVSEDNYRLAFLERLEKWK